jgi:rsbT antagonist protein RsbS
MAGKTASQVPLQMSNNCLVASIQIDLTADVLERFREDLLSELHARHARGVILDLSGIEVMDLSDFDDIRSTIAMAEIMGARTVICGLRDSGYPRPRHGFRATQCAGDAIRGGREGR